MLYALINSRSDCESRTNLAWGDLQAIADTVLYLCRNEMENIGDPDDLDGMEEDYSCSFKRYRELLESEEPTKEQVAQFYFQIDDLTIETCALVDGYSNLVEAFDEYTEDHMSLEEWELLPDMEETEENVRAMADELESLCDDLYDSDSLKFFRERDDDDEDDYEDEE